MQEQPTAKYLLINPNTNGLTTQRLQQALLPQIPSHARLEVIAASFGATYIACEASHAVAAHACVQAWADYLATDNATLKGVLIGCFGDPGLFALREMSNCPVTGLAEASFIQASANGPFAIVTGGERWKPMLHRLAGNLGFDKSLRHIETVVPSGAELQADPQMAIECLTTACKNASISGVKTLILGGAGLAGYAAQIQAMVDLPIIDSATAGLEVLLQQRAPQPTARMNGTYAAWTNMSNAVLALNKL